MYNGAGDMYSGAGDTYTGAGDMCAGAGDGYIPARIVQVEMVMHCTCDCRRPSAPGTVRSSAPAQTRNDRTAAYDLQRKSLALGVSNQAPVVFTTTFTTTSPSAS